MKIIDKTPLQDEKGNMSLTARVQAAFKYGLGWLAELQAQALLLPHLERLLDKSFVVIRNFNLPGSDILIPLIVIGMGGVYVIYVINEKGNFQAKGSEWSVMDSSGNPQPARINPLEKVTELTRYFQKYLDIHKIKLPAPLQTVVIDVNPGAQIETVRPATKVVKIDAIKNFAASLLQLPPIFRKEQVHDIAARIVEPPAPQEETPPALEADEPLPSYMVGIQEEVPASAKPFDANDLGFSFEEESSSAPNQAAAPVSSRAAVHPQSSRSFLGMTRAQVFVLAGLFVFWLCLMLGFGALFFFTL